MKHTATPYEVTPVKSDGITHYTIVDQNGKVIVDTFNSGVAEIHEEFDHDSEGNSWRNQWDEQGRLDAEFIKTACNAHDDLHAENVKLTSALHANKCHPEYSYVVLPQSNALALSLPNNQWERNQEADIPGTGDQCFRRKKE